jgi:hypothetical protein
MALPTLAAMAKQLGIAKSNLAEAIKGKKYKTLPVSQSPKKKVACT